MDQTTGAINHTTGNMMNRVLQNTSLPAFLEKSQREILQGKAKQETMEKLVYLILAYIYLKSNLNSICPVSQNLETNREAAI